MILRSLYTLVLGSGAFYLGGCCTPIQSNSFPQSVTETHTKTTISGAPSYSTPMMAPASIYQAPIQTMPVPVQLPPVSSCAPMQFSAPVQFAPPCQTVQAQNPCAQQTFQANPCLPQVSYQSTYQAPITSCGMVQAVQPQPIRQVNQENPCH